MQEQHIVETAVGQLKIQVLGQGQPVVLWHSLFVDDRSWVRLVPLIQGGRQLLIVTGPGHGTSTDPGRRYSSEECADAAITILDELGVQRPVDWVGNAWGGHVGVLAATRHPSRVRTLVMLGSPIAALSPLERARTYLLLGLYRASGPSPAVVNGTSKVLLSPRTRAGDAEAVDLVHDCLRRADRRMLRNAITSVSLHRTDLSDPLRHVAQPTLIITGADHQGFTPAQAQEATRLLASGGVATVPDAAYLVPLEVPATTAQLVADFWAAEDAATVSERRPTMQ